MPQWVTPVNGHLLMKNFQKGDMFSTRSLKTGEKTFGHQKPPKDKQFFNLSTLRGAFPLLRKRKEIETPIL